MASLFHSLVVCGAGLTLLQCGGRARSDEQGDGAQAGAESGSGETSGSGGATSTQGAAAGTSPRGEAGALALGGVPGAGGTFDGLPPPEVAAQWVCDLTDRSCRGDGIDFANVACVVDASRPRSAADCMSPDVFACLKGWRPEGTVAFNCECLPPDANGGCVCPTIDATFDVAASCTAEASLCGCAITCILVPK